MPSKIEVPSRAELTDVYYTNLSMLKTAEFFGVSKKLVMNWMNAYGIRRVTKAVYKELREPIRRLISSDTPLSTKEIAHLLCVSEFTVLKVCKDIGRDGVFDHFHKGFIISESGHKLLRVPSHPFSDCKGYVREHRLVVEDYLGRYLDPFEIVHHLDGDKLNNDISNLDICSRKAHIEHHKGY